MFIPVRIRLRSVLDEEFDFQKRASSVMDLKKGKSSDPIALQEVVQTIEKGDTGVTEGDGSYGNTSLSEKLVSEGAEPNLRSQSSSEYEEDIPETQPSLLDVLDKGFNRRQKRKAEEVGLPEDGIRYLQGESNSSVSDPVQMGTMVGGKIEVDSEIARKYAEHCADVDNDPHTDLIKLTMEEFMCQSEVNEAEFGPSEDLRTICIDAVNSPYSKEEQEKLWKLRHNRFVEVRRRKEQRIKACLDEEIVVSKDNS